MWVHRVVDHASTNVNTSFHTLVPWLVAGVGCCFLLMCASDAATVSPVVVLISLFFITPKHFCDEQILSMIFLAHFFFPQIFMRHLTGARHLVTNAETKLARGFRGGWSTQHRNKQMRGELLGRLSPAAGVQRGGERSRKAWPEGKAEQGFPDRRRGSRRKQERRQRQERCSQGEWAGVGRPPQCQPVTVPGAGERA